MGCYVRREADKLLALLPLLPRQDLLRIHTAAQQLLEQQSDTDRGLLQFYTVIQVLLKRDTSTSPPPLHVILSNHQVMARTIKQAYTTVHELSKGIDLAEVTRLCYGVVGSRLQRLRVPLTIKTVCEQLRKAGSLLEAEFPGYSAQVVKNVGNHRMAG